MTARRTRLCLAAGVAAAAVSALASPGDALATSRDVVVDSTTVELSPADAGKWTGKVTLLNLSDRPVVVSARARGGGCEVTPVPKALDPGRRAVIALTLSAPCEVQPGTDIVLTFGTGVSPAAGYVLAATPAAAAKPDWSILLRGFVLAALLSLVAVCAVYTGIWADLRGVGPATPLDGLGTDWSFKDNWVGTVTIGSAVIVALLGSSDVLEKVLGSKPEAALGMLTVAAAVSALLVGLAPLLIKAVGESLAIPTVGGTLLAGLVVLAGTLGQAVVVTWQAAVLTDGTLRAGTIALGASVCLTVLWYSIKALGSFVAVGTAPATAEPSETVKAAAAIVGAIDRLNPSGPSDAVDRLLASLAPASEQPTRPASFRNSLL